MNKDTILMSVQSLRYAKLFHEHGLIDDFIEAGFNKPDEEMCYYLYELCELCADICWLNFSEDNFVSMWYFVNHSMLEYNKLCREYGSKHSLKLKENPHIEEAQQFVSNLMHLDGYYGFDWYLNSGVGHDGASGLVFKTDDCFNGEFELISALLEMKRWYIEAVIRLKKVLSEEKDI